jgi:hypothetical protein
MFDCDPWMLPKKDSPVNRNKEKIELLKQVSVYPNPTSDIIIIKSLHKNYTVEITDIHGKVLYRKKNVNKINISNFTIGVYFITIKTIDSIETFKVLFI